MSIGDELVRGEAFASVDPSAPERVVARAHAATAAHVDAAIGRAVEAPARRGARTSAAERAAVLRRAAELLRARRLELAALAVRECGKPWPEADGDVCEAIDFLEYYAAGAEALGRGRALIQLPGERNTMRYVPRGVTGVIAPWNFPLAILCGMTSAALATGNAVVVKPAEQAPACAKAVVDALHAAGVPHGALSLLPGGDEPGKALVADPRDPHDRLHRLVRGGALDPGARGQGRAQPVPHQEGRRRDGRQERDHRRRRRRPRRRRPRGALQRVRLRGPEVQRGVARARPPAGRRRAGRAAGRRGAHAAGRAGRGLRHRRAAGDRRGRADARAALHRARARRPPRGWRRRPTRCRPATASTSRRRCWWGCPTTIRSSRTRSSARCSRCSRCRRSPRPATRSTRRRFALTGGLFSRSPRTVEEVAARTPVGNLYVNREITGAMVGPPALRRRPPVGHRPEGRGPRLPAAVRRGPRGHREHRPPRPRGLTTGRWGAEAGAASAITTRSAPARAAGAGRGRTVGTANRWSPATAGAAAERLGEEGDDHGRKRAAPRHPRPPCDPAAHPGAARHRFVRPPPPSCCGTSPRPPSPRGSASTAGPSVSRSRPAVGEGCPTAVPAAALAGRARAWPRRSRSTAAQASRGRAGADRGHPRPRRRRPRRSSRPPSRSRTSSPRSRASTSCSAATAMSAGSPTGRLPRRRVTRPKTA